MFASLSSLETYDLALIPPMFLACSVQVDSGGPGWGAGFPPAPPEYARHRENSVFSHTSLLCSLQSFHCRLPLQCYALLQPAPFPQGSHSHLLAANQSPSHLAFQAIHFSARIALFGWLIVIQPLAFCLYHHPGHLVITLKCNAQHVR